MNTNRMRVWFAPGLVLLLAVLGSAETLAEELDLADLDLPNAKTLSDESFHGMVLTGGQPTPVDIDRIAQSGYRTVINLRSEAEIEPQAWSEQERVVGHGMHYVAIPMAGPAGLTKENAERLAEIVDDPKSYPLLMHCASGNRVGALLALKAFHVDGLDSDAALAFGKKSGLTSFEPAVVEYLEQAPPQ